MSQRKDTRKGLGRGLSALIGDAEAVAPLAPTAEPAPEPATPPTVWPSTGSIPIRRSRAGASTKTSSPISPPRSASGASSSP